MVKEIKAYKTIDGEVFETEVKAKTHEKEYILRDDIHTWLNTLPFAYDKIDKDDLLDNILEDIQKLKTIFDNYFIM